MVSVSSDTFSGRYSQPWRCCSVARRQTLYKIPSAAGSTRQSKPALPSQARRNRLLARPEHRQGSKQSQDQDLAKRLQGRSSPGHVQGGRRRRDAAQPVPHAPWLVDPGSLRTERTTRTSRPGGKRRSSASGPGASSSSTCVDRSGSMLDDDRLTRAKIELRRSVCALQPPQRFEVIFYNDEATPMPGGPLPRPADQPTKTSSRPGST